MQQGISAVTARYATALFELAAEKGQLDAVSRDVGLIEREHTSGALAALFDPRAAAADRTRAVDGLAARLSPLSRNLLLLLRDKRRLEVLRELAAGFRVRLLASQNAVDGVAWSARPLGASELAQLSTQLGSALGKTVQLENRLDPELIGGVRVLVDNLLLDQSAAGRLEGLRARLLEARLD